MTEPRHKSVLIVDDDADVRLALRTVLEEDGYHVTEASNGAEAFAVLVAGWLPSLIFLDKHMPEMDGERFIREIEGHGILANLPIVVITGDRLISGSRVYLQKPISVQRILDVAKAFAR